MNTQTYPLKSIRVEFVLRDATGKTTNHWQKRFQTEKRALSYFNKLKTQWQGEREASMYPDKTASGNAPKLIEDHERTEDARTEARLDAIYDREEEEAE